MKAKRNNTKYQIDHGLYDLGGFLRQECTVCHAVLGCITVFFSQHLTSKSPVTGDAGD